MNEKRRAVVIFVVVTLTFLVGLYVGSVGVIDPVQCPALVRGAGDELAAGDDPRADRRHAASTASSAGPNEIGQIYTSVAGLLNLLCIVNAIYMAHLRVVGEAKA